jgi:hypothetical protein
MNKEKGFIKWILLIVIALIILGYYGFDVRKAIDAPTTQSNLNWFKETCLWIWDHILRWPAEFVWNSVILPLIHKLSGGGK